MGFPADRLALNLVLAEVAMVAGADIDDRAERDHRIEVEVVRM